MFLLVKTNARWQERTKVKAVRRQRVVVLSLMRPHNIAGDSPEANSQENINTITPPPREEMRGDVEVLLLLPAI